MHVVVGNELHSRYDKVELVFPGGDERQINKAKGAGVRKEWGRGKGAGVLLLLCVPYCCAAVENAWTTETSGRMREGLSSSGVDNTRANAA